MSDKNERCKAEKVKFSIGVKFVIIVSSILIISLGFIIAMVSLLDRASLRISAEENNLETNSRSAAEAELILVNVRSNSRVLMQTINAAGPQTVIAQETADFFFNENPQAAALFFVIPDRGEQVLINKRFSSSGGVDEVLVTSFFGNQRSTLDRAARGETLLANAAPYFSYPCLALFFSWQSGEAGGVLFSSETLNNVFGFGKSLSYMINSNGEILAHSNASLVRSGTNIRNEDFIRYILNSTERNSQRLVESDSGFLQVSKSTARAGILYSVCENIKKVYRSAKQKILSLLKKISGFIPALNIGDNTGEGKKNRHFVVFTKLNTTGAVVITAIEYDRVFEGAAAATRRNIFLAIAVLSVSIVFIWFFSKTISNPLKSLACAANKIENGEFDLEFQPKGNDEIGVLTSSFGKMCSALQVFGRFSNKEVAAKTIRGEIKRGGFPKNATVLFSDIYEFTAKLEKFTKVFHDGAYNKIVRWLNNYLAGMSGCVEKANGVVDRFAGGSVTAHWGTVRTAGNPRKDAFNCVKAALMMRKALYLMNRGRKANDPANPSIKTGCGINSGIVIAGQLGSDKHMEYTVFGDHVNIASNIEALTESMGADILISESTWRLVGDKFLTEEMPSVTINNKPMRIFAVVNFKGEPKGPQTMAEVRKLLDIEVSYPVNKDAGVDWKSKR